GRDRRDDRSGGVDDGQARDLARAQGAVVQTHLVKSAREVGRCAPWVAREAEAGGRRGGAGGAGPGACGLLHAIHVQSAARGVHDEGDVVPRAIGEPRGGQGAAGAVPDVVGGIPEIPRTEAAAVDEDLVAVEGGGEVLVDDTVQAGVSGFDPGREREREGVESRSARDVDVVIDAVEGEALADPAGDPGGTVDEGAVEAVAGRVGGQGAAPVVELPVGDGARGGRGRRRLQCSEGEVTGGRQVAGGVSGLHAIVAESGRREARQAQAVRRGHRRAQGRTGPVAGGLAILDLRVGGLVGRPGDGGSGGGDGGRLGGGDQRRGDVAVRDGDGGRNRCRRVARGVAGHGGQGVGAV